MLARVVVISGLDAIDGADRIEVAKVLGWQVVVKKGEHRVGEKAIYVNIGSKLDVTNPHFASLEGKPIKTKKIRGVVSQGIVFQISILPSFGLDPDQVKEGDDMTAALRVEKWIPEEEAASYKPDQAKTVFPQLVPKTDEERVQNLNNELQRLKDLKVVITQKFDGTSNTFAFLFGSFMICGRNFRLLVSSLSTKHHFEIAERYGLEEKMTKLGRNIAIQGEIIGPKINGNRHRVSENEFYVFNIYDVDAAQYMEWNQILEITQLLGLKTVTCVYQGIMKDEWLDSSALLRLAEEQIYPSGQIAEGIVIKSDSCLYPSRFSCKAISNKYLLKYGL